MTIEEFIDNFQPIRNTYVLVTPLENIMFENDDGDQIEYVESKDSKYVWSYNPRVGLINGFSYKPDVIGYIVCKKECLFKPGKINVKI